MTFANPAPELACDQGRPEEWTTSATDWTADPGAQSAFRHAPAPSRQVPRQVRRQVPRRDPGDGVEGNSRMTGSTALVLLIMLAAEGVTVLRIHSLLTWHVVIGMMLIPPVLVKVASTTWRFVKYYSRSPAYQRKGPPPTVLRLLGPVVVVLTVTLLASGVALLLAPVGWRGRLLQLHQASFVLWFLVMTIHVLGHLGDTVRLALLDWMRRTRRVVAGSRARRRILGSSLVIGAFLAALAVPHVAIWLNARG